jgi:predicted amidohydrolase
MPRQVKIATVQLEATPAPTGDRLARAARLARQAAASGAQLVVLPELFNTGYAYVDVNYHRAERLNGPTVGWMRQTAADLGIHLAGSLLLLDEDEVYNAMLLVAPDGRLWRYDKVYPWGWERSYFRNGRDITVADTELGRIGMLVCWDVAHPDLWRRYAGRVDLMLVVSCPPNVGEPSFQAGDGSAVGAEELGPVMRALRPVSQRTFGEVVEEQVAWLGVPAAQTTATGRIKTRLPYARASLLVMAPVAPALLKFLGQANDLQMACDLVAETKILDPRGRVLAKLAGAQGESFAVADVTLADMRPTPRGKQPATRLPMLAYLTSDYLLTWLAIPVYRSGLRRALGGQMAPVDPAARQWLVVAGIVAVVAFLFGRATRRRGARR